MGKVQEAVTIKAQAQGALKMLGDLLGNKALPEGLVSPIRNLRTALRKTWKDLKAETEEPEAKPETTEAKEAGAFSYRDIENILRSALKTEAGQGTYAWVRDLWDDQVVYEVEGQTTEGMATFQRPYVLDAQGKVTFGDPVKVLPTMVYVPVAEALRVQQQREVQPQAQPQPQPQQEARAVFEGDIIPLVEKAVRRDGTIPVKVIQPGWGSSGYYPAEVLQRDGPKIFPAGTKMYWNHPTKSEEAERPERDLRDLAATTVTDAVWQDQGAAGPGLYTDAQVFGTYQEAVNELAPHIGVSIRAWGAAKDGEAEGRKGKIIEKLTVGESVDFVTQAGAGGQVVQLFESARRNAAESRQEVREVNEEEARQLRESNAQLTQEVARLKEAQLLAQTRELVVQTLAGVELPAPTRARLTETLAGQPVLTQDGQLDRPAMVLAVAEAAKRELAYLVEAGGLGQIRGMGSRGGGEVDMEQAQGQLESALVRLGLSEKAASVATRGR
jgi:hypothetical protein